jgi:hypothetical protein
MPRFGSLGAAFGRLGASGRTAGVFIPGVITAQKGTFNITGFDAGLVASHLPLTAAAGSFAITGVDAALTYSGSGSSQNTTAVFISNLQY